MAGGLYFGLHCLDGDPGERHAVASRTLHYDAMPRLCVVDVATEALYIHSELCVSRRLPRRMQSHRLRVRSASVCSYRLLADALDAAQRYGSMTAVVPLSGWSLRWRYVNGSHTVSTQVSALARDVAQEFAMICASLAAVLLLVHQQTAQLSLRILLGVAAFICGVSGGVQTERSRASRGSRFNVNV